MNDNRQKAIVTESDSIVNTINIFGEIKYIASCMTKSIKPLHGYVRVNVEHQTHYKYITKKSSIKVHFIS